MSTEPMTFRVYPTPRRSGLYAIVRVFRTHKAMLQTVRAEDKRDGLTERIPDDTRGCVQTFVVRNRTRGGKWKTTQLMCVVNLYRARLGMVVLAHEFGHAMFAWAKRKRLPGTFAGREDMDVEEMVLHAQSEMLRQFMVTAEKRGLYGKGNP